MATKKSTLLQSLEAQGRRVLTVLQKEIADLEGQLTHLRDQAERWAAALEQRTRPTNPSSATGAPKGKRKKAAKKRARRTSPAVDWDAVLERLPRTFTMQDIAKRTPKLANHPKSRVVAVARWSRMKAIQKIGDGKYRKLA